MVNPCAALSLCACLTIVAVPWALPTRASSALDPCPGPGSVDLLWDSGPTMKVSPDPKFRIWMPSTGPGAAGTSKMAI
jgi:hypothetical protein